jgi:hypothetical protein
VAKKVTEVPVEINELALSLLGWEVQDFRARVTTDQYEPDGKCFHKLAISGVFRFNDADWVDCFSFSREYPTHPVMLPSSPSISNRPAVCRLNAGAIKKGRPVRIAAFYVLGPVTAGVTSTMRCLVSGCPLCSL